MNNKKKIYAISDIHGYLPDIPECDILCICGDILPLNIQLPKDFVKAVAWLAGPFQSWAFKLPCKNVVMIWGNHDFIGELLYNCGGRSITSYEYIIQNNKNQSYTGQEQHDIIFHSDVDNKIIILQDEKRIIQGLNFYGTPWCPELKQWAFYGDSEFLSETFNKIPQETQILLTHCPPKYGTQGVVLDNNNGNYGRDFGSEELQDAVEKIFQEKSTNTIILSGHIHSGNHNIESRANIYYRNVSLADERYRMPYKPFEFEIDTYE